MGHTIEHSRRRPVSAPEPAGVTLSCSGRGWGVAMVVVAAAGLLLLARRHRVDHLADGSEPFGPIDGS